jgi:hypothetical protein
MTLRAHMHHGQAYLRGQHRKWLDDLAAWRTELAQAADSLARAGRLLANAQERLSAHERLIHLHDGALAAQHEQHSDSSGAHVERQARHEALRRWHQGVTQATRELLAALEEPP